MSKIYLKDGTTRESLFEDDNFTSRRTTGNNLYDPESLLTGKEIEQGLDYTDPRVWPSYAHYLDACEGYFTPEEVAEIAPRKRVLKYLERLAA